MRLKRNFSCVSISDAVSSTLVPNSSDSHAAKCPSHLGPIYIMTILDTSPSVNLTLYLDFGRLTGLFDVQVSTYEAYADEEGFG